MPRWYVAVYIASAKEMSSEMIPMEVIGVRVEMPSNQPIILLREIDGTRFLPIWVGAVEATAIAFAQQGLEPPRPLTHDLMAQLFEKFDASLVAVHINELRDGVFYSTLILASLMILAHFTISEGIQVAKSLGVPPTVTKPCCFNLICNAGSFKALLIAVFTRFT